jgi:hypothetical protein
MSRITENVELFYAEYKPNYKRLGFYFTLKRKDSRYICRYAETIHRFHSLNYVTNATMDDFGCDLELCYKGSIDPKEYHQQEEFYIEYMKRNRKQIIQELHEDENTRLLLLMEVELRGGEFI